MPSYSDIPDYQVHLMNPLEQHRDLVFIFVYNESDKLKKQLDRFPPQAEREYDIMIGDDGSTDGSVDVDMLKNYGVRGMVALPENSGLSTNIRAGLHWMLHSSSYRSVIMMNGNNKDDPTAVPRFIEKIEQDVHYVQGSRFLPGGSLNNTPTIRFWAIRLIHSPLFSLAAGRWMTDTTNGFRAFSRDLLENPVVHPFQSRFKQYEIEQYLAWKALRLSYTCQEIHVARDYPERTDHPVSISKITPGIGYWMMIKPLLCLLLRCYK